MDMKETWKAVDAYLDEKLQVSDEVTDTRLEKSDAAGLPPIEVSAMQGKMLYLLRR